VQNDVELKRVERYQHRAKTLRRLAEARVD
jgi:hypothetical protein